MSGKEQQIPRPVPVSVTLYVLAFAGIFSIIYSFTGAFAHFGLFYPAACAILTVVMFASFAGIGSMEKWGVYVFLAVLALRYVLDLYTGAFQWWLLLLLLPAGIFLAYLKKMK